MLFKTHLLLGIIFFLLFKNTLLVGGNVILFFCFVLLGSLLPDIDQPGSKITQWSGIIGNILSRLTKHRGFFHSLFFFLILTVLLSYFFNYYYGLALMIGYFAHLLGDCLTPAGVQIFYPFSKFKIRGPIKTGSVAEWLILMGLILLILRELIF